MVGPFELKFLNAFYSTIGLPDIPSDIIKNPETMKDKKQIIAHHIASFQCNY